MEVKLRREDGPFFLKGTVFHPRVTPEHLLGFSPSAANCSMKIESIKLQTNVRSRWDVIAELDYSINAPSILCFKRLIEMAIDHKPTNPGSNPLFITYAHDLAELITHDNKMEPWFTQAHRVHGLIIDDCKLLDDELEYMIENYPEWLAHPGGGLLRWPILHDDPRVQELARMYE